MQPIFPQIKIIASMLVFEFEKNKVESPRSATQI